MTKPNGVGDSGTAWSHNLEAVEGNFGQVVWECVICGEIRTEKEYYRNLDCEETQ